MKKNSGPITFKKKKKKKGEMGSQAKNSVQICFFAKPNRRKERGREVEGKEEEGESRGRSVFLSSTLSAEPSKLIAGHFMCMLN